MRAGRWTASPTLFMCKVASSFLKRVPPANIGRLPRSLACADAHPYPSMPCALFLAGLCSRPSSGISLFWRTPLGVVLCTCNACSRLAAVGMYLTSIVPVLARLQDGDRCTESAQSCEHVPPFFPIRHVHVLYKV
jgi:hypothetical protein